MFILKLLLGCLMVATSILRWAYVEDLLATKDTLK